MRLSLLAVLIVLTALFVSPWVPARAGVSAQVTIYRDEFGVPHIYGTTAEAAAFGLGYAQAEDHLTQMRFNFLKAAGRLAEFGLGSAANDNQMYLYHVPQTAQATYEALVPEHRSRLDAFVAGINQYIYEHASELPSWVVYVQPYEVLAWIHYIAIAEQSTIARSEMQAGGASATNEASMPDAEASNMWAIAPARSSLGVAMLNGDPHLPWTSMTRQWYEAHLNYPGANVGGALFFGFPAIVMGANDNVAWSMTNNGADTADVYAETFNPDNPLEYLRDGSWVPLNSETVSIKELVGGELVDRTFTNYYSVHGPIIGLGNGVYYAAAMANFDYVPDRLVLFDANEATSVAFDDPSAVPAIHKWNIIAADRAGNIAYRWNARVAHKPESVDWKRPVDGSTSANDWGPFLTVGELPQAVNPSWGYLQNANNSAWVTAPTLDPADYPSYVGGSGTTDRAIRAIEILDSQPQHSLQDMIDMAFDTLSVRARSFVPVALDVWAEVQSSVPDPTGDLQATMDLLAGWDYRQEKTNREVAIGRLLIDGFFDRNPSFSAQDIPPASSWTQADKDKFVAALQDAVSFMRTNIGVLDPLWGDVHQIQRGSTVVGVGGGSHELPALHMANADQFQDGVWVAKSGSSYVYTVAFTDPIQFYSIRPLGESEDPASPHYADQTILFANSQFKQLWMTLADVQANAQSTTTLTYDGPAHDTDSDGCPDVRETSTDPTQGGLRDPTSFWDFFDTPDPNASPQRDRSVTLADLLRVIDRFGAIGDPTIDPLSTPPKTGYHPAYDRGGVAGVDPWDQAPADGAISLVDILAVLAQFGHSCA